MTIDDINAIWKRYDARLDEALPRERVMRQTLGLVRVEPLLQRLAWQLTWAIVFDAVAVLAIGGVVAGGGVSVEGQFVGALLAAYAIAILIAAVVQRVLLTRVTYDGTVVTVAERVDRFALLRARVTFWTLATAPLMWVPLLVVTLRGLAGIDAMVAFDRIWIAANFAFGIAVLALAFLAARRGWVRTGRMPALDRLRAHLSGTTVLAAEVRLATLLDEVREEAG